jgi:hypothetical protein
MYGCKRLVYGFVNVQMALDNGEEALDFDKPQQEGEHEQLLHAPQSRVIVDRF